MMEKHQDAGRRKELPTLHVEQANSVGNGSRHPLVDYNYLSYGQSGVKGIIGSPYILGAAALASMGGFSFGYGASLTN